MTRRHLAALAIMGAFLGLWLSPGRAYAYQFQAPDTHVKTLRVVNVEPDNGRSLMWTLNNGASYKTKRPAACRQENRPRLCRQAYRIATRDYGTWWRLHVKRIDPAPAGPRITVTLSNGKRAVLRPCAYEDSPRCYWQADRFGNGRGRSFVAMSGHVFYVNMRGFDPAARIR